MMGVCHDYIFSKKYKVFCDYLIVSAFLRVMKNTRVMRIMIVAYKNFAKYYFHL